MAPIVPGRPVRDGMAGVVAGAWRGPRPGRIGWWAGDGNLFAPALYGHFVRVRGRYAVVTWAARRKGRNARYAGRRAANSPAMRFLARAGLVARGAMYVIIGWIAAEIAFGNSRQQADRTGALHVAGGSRFGAIALWLLVIGFIGLALWRLSEAIYGSPGSGGQKASTRLAALARAVIYSVVAYGILKYALGVGSPGSSNQQSVDLTATGMKPPGGRAGSV